MTESIRTCWGVVSVIIFMVSRTLRVRVRNNLTFSSPLRFENLSVQVTERLMKIKLLPFIKKEKKNLFYLFIFLFSFDYRGPCLIGRNVDLRPTNILELSEQRNKKKLNFIYFFEYLLRSKTRLYYQRDVIFFFFQGGAFIGS